MKAPAARNVGALRLLLGFATRVRENITINNETATSLKPDYRELRDFYYALVVI